ncbi:MAG TPA: MBL fold metallo-hydrolase [Gemmatimonadaceae bacterium]|nr:MBL fold metallo-hydrolase [Gemmatimonadaceae bacterium]
MTLRLRFWGTRGSVPAPGPRTVRYGGNTPCLEVRTDTGALVILDAGTGIRELGRSLVADGDGISAEIFLTHAHWDHIQGIPFFAPIFRPGNRFTIWGSKALETSIDRVIRDQMAPVVFPVGFDELQARVEFREIAVEERTGDGYVVSSFAVQHPGGALGYRFTDASQPKRSFVYISDNELGASEGYGSGAGWREALVAFVRGASLLVHDATYTTDEYAQHRGWGHSTFEDAVMLALDAGVQRLVLYHHKPERSDDDIDACVAACRALVARRGETLEVTAAAEGMTLEV